MASEPGTPADAPGGAVTAADDTAEGFAVPGFDAVARLAAHSLRAPVVSLVLATGSSYWFSADDAQRPHSPHALHPLYVEAARRDGTQVVLDTQADQRFGQAPLLTDVGLAAMRFFASEPVYTLSGQHVGALCVMDYAPRDGLTPKERDDLRDAAELAGTGLVLGSYLGRTDPVTQLPHRNAFFEDLRARQRGGAHRAWLLAIDVAPVSRFNAFVRALGHAYADELLRDVAARVQLWMPRHTHLYQVGSHRFAAVLPDTPHTVDAAQLDALVHRLRQPFDCLGIPLTLQPGVGLLQMDVRELDGGDPLRLVMSATHAAQHCVRGWSIYEPADDEQHRQEFFLVTELAAALGEGTELDLHYQPRVELASGRCVAVEALARWQHPTLGAIPPGRFIALAEQAGLMRTLTLWVLRQAIAQLAAWHRQGLELKLSLNVSSSDLGAELIDQLTAVAASHQVALDAIELEFTESTLLEHSDTTREHLAAIRALGVGIAIDDFGTGYSNLTSLRQMPATSLKIDQSFVRAMGASRHDGAIVRAMAELAHELGFRVVVEGVETPQIFEAVRRMACDEVQGFHIARPMPAAEIAGWLARRASPTA
ncbi:sensor domain-containing phosphodiesterase [Dyella sp.]|jgi:EAL domain-containing protein (putative c-di-GMP-specific phosphodiesterase class I)/GGDEF domain-containing protein|uniref:putative bifunctional diguanylate cyclase/phosphodiesterase n=1 Tax=Dyella sp. TaxID=1869338 RepID=UPI002D7784BC|nr:sensor domain-containing phosphodiesterase [Dyella sp.]HET6431796.1 sensor domain-containing phosphodiesterase [Dyella sp.]